MRVLRFFLRTLLYLVLTVVILFVLCMVFPPAAAVTFGVLDGAVYHKAGTVVLHYREKEITVPVYKSRGKPFLLVGPHVFYYPDEDFLFVSPDEVIATAIDKGSCWIRLFGLLFMFDDMTSKDRLRIPYWNLLKNRSPDVSVSSIKGAREYRVIVDDGRKLTFFVPESLFTPDMPPAEPYLESASHKQAHTSF